VKWILKRPPHPSFVIKMAEYFELAWEEYVDSLGMKVAMTEYPSRFYDIPVTTGKYQVDVVDISEAENYHTQEVYALTYPPGLGEGIVMENDFLYNFNFSSSFPDYRPITSVYNRGPEPQLIDYSIDWQKGLKVTAVHEFYHSVQYAYTPDFVDFDYHFWYEASATGMEEHLATEVNDYLQYLPDIIDKHRTSSLTRDCGSCLEIYGNGIFFTYLTYTLGNGFDKGIWENLEAKMNLENAMESVFAESNGSMAELYPGFVGPIVFARSESPNPFELYSSDIHRWPALSRLELDHENLESVSLKLPPLTYAAYDIKIGNSTRKKKVEFTKGESVNIAAVYKGVLNSRVMDSLQNGYIFTFPR